MSVPQALYKSLPKRRPLSLGFDRYALHFDGLEDLVEVPHTISLNTPNELTIGLLFKMDIVGVAYRLISKGRYDSGWDCAMSADSRLTIPYWNGLVWDNVISNLINWVAGRWYFIYITLDAVNTTAHFYQNLNDIGVFDPPALVSIGNTASPVRIGTNTLNSNFLDGSVALAVMYNRILSNWEVRRNIMDYHNPLREGLVLWLPLEEGSGLTAYDQSGQGNNGDLLPALTPPVWESLRKWEPRTEVDL